MRTPSSSPEAAPTDPVRIGALVPLSRPGWVEAGRHLLAGLELAVREVNDEGGSSEDHSSWWSATPPLIRGRPRRPSGNLPAWAWPPWRGSITASSLAKPPPGPTPSACRTSARQRFSTRSPCSLAEVTIGAPAGQPEFAGWARSLGDDGAAIPFLRYLPERLNPLGARVETALRERLGEAPSFVAFEGYDTVAVLADVLRTAGTDRPRIAASWPRVAVEGTRGRIGFSRVPGIGVRQWAWPPIQVVDRDPAAPERFRILHTDGAQP
ncbi:ABC transporter substrate-binding protein [Nonomuraea sp. K271]|uniref:ABC transporter substrate-binding protein n=1 Tax=Nonomuraea sp. K271 TaxID=1848319 RepID=UPI0026A0855C